MISILLFLLGAAFTVFAYQKMWILCGLVAFFSFFLIIGVEKSLTERNSEAIIKKLTYIYVILSVISSDNNPNGRIVTKVIRRILKEIALEVCGIKQYSMWVKWEAYHNKQLSNMTEKEKE